MIKRIRVFPGLATLTLLALLPPSPLSAGPPGPVEQGAVVRQELVARALADLTAERLSWELSADLDRQACSSSSCAKGAKPISIGVTSDE